MSLVLALCLLVPIDLIPAQQAYRALHPSVQKSSGAGVAMKSFLRKDVESSRLSIPKGVIGLVVGATLGGIAGRRLEEGACESSCNLHPARATVLGAIVGGVFGYGLERLFRW